MYDVSTRRKALELLASGLSMNAVSKALGVSRAAIREWRDRPDARDKRVHCPAPAQSIPEYSALFGFYLGDGCVSAHRRTFSLRVTCDETLPGIIRDVARCVHAVHPERDSYLVTAPGVVVVQNYWNHWPCLFPQHGAGRKHERSLVMADWQRDIVEAYPADFLRGLFHSDGCRVNNWATRMVGGEKKRYEYPRWQFTNMSPDIMRWCGEALDLIDVPWRRSNHKTLSVSTRAGVARLDELIGLKS